MRILIVDDAIAYRSQLKAVLSSEPGMEVVGTAANGKIALQKLEQQNIDLVILDIEMPELNGIDTVKAIKAKGYDDLNIIMFSSLSRAAAVSTLEALQAGADDVVAKPGAESKSMEESIDYIKQQLIPKVKQFASGKKVKKSIDTADKFVSQRTTNLTETDSSKWKHIDLSTILPKAILVASSTGGPQALEDLFTSLGTPTCPPILIVQHMPPVFTKMLAKRLNTLSSYTFKEAENGELAQKGHAYIAPGDFHMEIITNSDKKMCIKLHQGPKLNSVRPAADYLFRSGAELLNNWCLGIVLTGMGEDGLQGAVALKNSGSGVFIQNKESCVVWGMPAAVHEAKAFDQVGTLADCQQILRRF